MKHLKLFESFRDEDIRTICDRYWIGSYTINADGSIDVDADIDLGDVELTKLPLKFKNVNGEFYCQYNNLTSLEGCPESVSGTFECENNHLTSLEGGPKSIGGSFYCYNNRLTSLENGPKSVGDGFYCSYNNLTSLKGCPESVGGGFDCSRNKLKTFEHLPFSIGGRFNCIGNPIYKIWELFEDYSKIELFNYYDIIQDGVIILDRLNTFLEEIGKTTITEIKGYKCI
jgi:hypothetical protein